MSPDSVWLGFRKALGIRKYSVMRNLKMELAEVKEDVGGT